MCQKVDKMYIAFLIVDFVSVNENVMWGVVLKFKPDFKQLFKYISLGRKILSLS